MCEVRDGDVMNVGEQDEDKSDEFLPKDSPELYENKTIAQKLFVVSAGVLMNIIFAIFLVIFCASVYHKLPTSTQDLFVDGFSPKMTSNANQVGILKGDKIIKINDTEVKTLYQLSFFAKNSKLFDDFLSNDFFFLSNGLS